jgi:hypothetical protein
MMVQVTAPKRDGRVSFLGGNGHGAARLDAARRFLPPDLDLVDTPYPGFEGRPRAASFEAFLDAVAAPRRWIFRSPSPAIVCGWTGAVGWWRSSTDLSAYTSSLINRVRSQ